MEKRLEYLENKVPEGLDVNDKYGKTFEKHARYLGNGVYSWDGLVATDTCELLLMGSLQRENINFKRV